MSKHTSHANRGITSNFVFTVIIVVVLAIAAVVTYFLLKSDSRSGEFDDGIKPMVPTAAGIDLPLVQLDGQWADQINNSKFLATVKDGTIKIEFGSDVTTMVYWYGSFESAEENGTTITSKAIDTGDITMSDLKEKDFLIKDDAIWFTFEAMGMKTKVGLTRA